MVTQVVLNVKSDNRTLEQLMAASRKQQVSDTNIEGMICPVCKKGTVIKGNTAYGCSEWKSGCTYRKPFSGA